MKQILRDVEAGYIERFRRYCVGRCVNKNLPNRTRKQYDIDNADKKKEYLKQYYIDNADKIKEQVKQYKQKKRVRNKKPMEQTFQAYSS